MKRWRLAGMVTGLVLIGLGIYSFLIEPARLTVREVELRSPSLPALRLALVADIHGGSPFITEAKLRRLVARTNALNPDLVLLLGDYVIQGVAGGRFIEPERIAAILSGLRPRFGTYAVLGNHDGWLDPARVRRALEQNGIRVLRNEVAVVTLAGGKTVVLAGLADLWTDQPNLGVIRPSAAPMIVMTHNPDVFPQIPSFVALTVAGHTHGGQVALPLIGRLVVPSRFGQRYAAGHIVENGRHLYVTTGVGTSIIPVRFRVVPEVTLLRIVPGTE